MDKFTGDVHRNPQEPYVTHLVFLPKQITILKKGNNINNNVIRYRELRSLSGNPTSRPCLRVKDSQGKEITSVAGKLEELRVFYEDLYSSREPNCTHKADTNDLLTKLESNPAITIFYLSKPTTSRIKFADKSAH